MELVNIVTSWRRNIHFLARATKEASRIAATSPYMQQGHYEVLAAYTKLRLAYRWLGFFEKFLEAKYEVQAANPTESDPLPDLDGFVRYSQFIVKQCAEQLVETSRTPAEAYTADAQVIAAFLKVKQYLQETIFLLEMAMEDTRRANESGTEV